MNFAKQPSQPPDVDFTALWNYLTAVSVKTGVKLPSTANPRTAWRWIAAIVEQDGKGLRDVVAANALALNAVKADLDKVVAANAALTARVASLEAKPAVPFPVSGLPQGLAQFHHGHPTT